MVLLDSCGHCANLGVQATIDARTTAHLLQQYTTKYLVGLDHKICFCTLQAILHLHSAYCE